MEKALNNVNNQNNQHRFTPLHYAVMSGNWHIVIELLRQGASNNHRGQYNRRPSDVKLNIVGYTSAAE